MPKTKFNEHSGSVLSLEGTYALSTEQKALFFWNQAQSAEDHRQMELWALNGFVSGYTVSKA